MKRIPQELLGSDSTYKLNLNTQRVRTLFQQLTRLSLFHYHASNVTGTWNPLYESLGTFAQRGRPAIWWDHTPHPGPDAVMAWLRKQMGHTED